MPANHGNFMTDSELIAKILAGETAAFNTLVWRWQKPIYNFILRFIGSQSEEAHDLTQQVFVRVHQSLPRLKNPESFSSWIYQIAANLCRDWIKQKRRRTSVSLEKMKEAGALDVSKHEELTLSTDSIHHPDQIVSRKQLRGLLEKALSEIPDEQRIVVVMKEFQGLKFIEIAEALNQPINTVKSRLYYGLTALRKVLAKWDIDREVLQYEM